MATLTINKDGDWRPARKNETIYVYKVEYSRSGRARCRKCSDMIASAVLRISTPIRHSAGAYGYIDAWSHLNCTRADPAFYFNDGADSSSAEDDDDGDGDDSNKNKNAAAAGGVAQKKMRSFLSRHVYGLDGLKTDEDRKRVLDELNNSKRPEHLKELDPDDLVKRGALPQVEPPATILQHLLPYQKEGLGWMINQETGTEYKGGILADDMGMGKSIQIVSLITARKGTSPTLIVAPVSAIMQWQDEISNHVVPDELSVYVLTSQPKKNNKNKVRDAILLADVVLTTYPVLEHSWRALVDDTKVKCKFCSKMFVPKKLQFHNTYFCGPNAKRTQKQLKREQDGTDNKKVQSEKTIKKGLRTLGAELDDDDDDDDVQQEDGKKKGGGGGGGAPGVMGMYAELMQDAGRRVRSRWEKPNIESDDDDDDTAAAKKAKSSDDDADVTGPVTPRNAASSKKQQPAAKGKRSSSSSTATPKPSPKPKQKRGGGGGGRRRKQETSSDDETSSSSSSDDDDDDELSSDDDDSSSSSDEENAASATNKKNKKQKKQNINDDDDDDDAADAAIVVEIPKDECDTCGLAIKKHPFCPKTGKAHPKPLSKAEIARLKSGVQLKPLPDDGAADVGADDVTLGNSVLHSIVWHRIVLDEAHRIKGRTTSTSRAAFALRADFKWCVTGTPLQNRVGDLYSLLRFLRMAPFARYYCQAEGCACSTLSHPFSTDMGSNFCVYCGHGPLQHYSHFNKHILNPITRYGYVGDGRTAMLLLARSVLQHIMLRRTKHERAADLKLPPCTVEVRQIELTEAERDFYESLYKKSTAKFDTFVSRGTLLHNYAHIFQLLSRLRQALDHPYLVLYSDTGSTVTSNANRQQPQPQQQQQPVAATATNNNNNTNNNDDDDDPFAAAAAAMGLAADGGNNNNNNHQQQQQQQQLSPADTFALKHLPAAAAVPAEVCGICQESTGHESRVRVRPCGHCFCRVCLLEYIESCPDQPGAGDGGGGNADGAAADAAVNFDDEDEDTPLVNRLAKLAPKKVAAQKPSAKGKKGAKKKDDDAATSGICCPRCFVGIHVDLQNLAAAVVGGGTVSSSDDDDEDEDDDEMAGTDEAGGAGNRRQRGGKKKPAASSAAAKKNKKQQQQPQQDNNDDDDDPFGGAFAMADFAAVQAPGAEQEEEEYNGDGAAAAAAADKKNTNNNNKNIPRSTPASTILRKVDTTKFVGSTKLDSIVQCVRELAAKGEKTIVFSQFGAMLDIIEFSLERAGVRAVKLVGSMQLSSRLATLRAFRTEPAVAVILISLKAGGEGLNLQVANNVILADIWWNPAVEMQAIQRAHRIGQTKAVKAIRFVTKSTVEEKMMELQEKKQLVFEGTVDGKFEALQRLSEDDLRFLFTT